MSYCTVCDVADKKPQGRCPACGRNWGPSILDGIVQGPFDDKAGREFSILPDEPTREAMDTMRVYLPYCSDGELRDLYTSILACGSPPNVLAIGNPCIGGWIGRDQWQCRCGAKIPEQCKTETAKP